MREISLSATLAIKAEADRLRAAGVSVIDFGPGEPDFDTPRHIKDAAHRAIDENFTHYTQTPGISELRAAIAGRYAASFDTGWSADEVVVGCGAKNLLFAIAQALFSPGDEVAVFAPYWVSYPDQIRMAGARAIVVPTREADGFTPRAGDLTERLTSATRAVILNSPCNPTGSVIPMTELRAFAELARSRDLVVISDEVYEAFTYDGEKHASMASLADMIGDRLVVVSACSKSYAMTGWRVGYALGPSEIIRPVTKVLSHDSSQASSISQKAALAALTGPQERLTSMRVEYERRRNFIVSALQAMPGMQCATPRGAFYAFPNVTGLFEGFGVSSSTELANALVKQARCTTVPGEAFGMEGYLRVSYATSMDNLREGVDRIRRAVVAAGTG